MIMSQFKKPAGVLGRIFARGMAWGHRDFYRNTARILSLEPDDKYLEAGFGSGMFIRKYAAHVADMAGIDCSEDMVTLAKAVNRDLVNSNRADFIQGDVTSLPWPSERFSAVACIETFYFWKEPLSALREIFRVLMPGGRLVIEMAFNKDDGLDHTKEIRKMGLKLYSADEMKEALEASGFGDVECFFYQGFKIPFKGYVVPKGMIIRAYRK
jgi:ubiquinone/menaquinone biosynthesis C-methylase UbiE